MKLPAMNPLGMAGFLLLLGVDLWLLKIVATEIFFENATSTDNVEWNTTLTASSGAVAAPKPIDSYREIVAHPVFFKSRAPHVAPPPPPPVVAAPPPPPVPVDPGLVLGGVMIKPDFRKAYVFSRAGTNGAWIKEGEDFMGWKAVSIGKGGAKLQQAGRSMELLLYPE